jgi:serine/threonine protein kinase
MEDRNVFQKPIDGLRVFRQTCAGVAHAHKAGIFHLDIKRPTFF